MGGSGSGGYTPSAPSSPCSRITFQATLNSPKQAVLAKLQTGYHLDVQLAANGQSVEVFYLGELAGALTGPQIAQLINCLNTGFVYRATVLSKSGGTCVLSIEGA